MSSKPKKVSQPTPIDPLFNVPDGAEEEFTYSRDINDVDFAPAYIDGRNPIKTPFGVLYGSAETGGQQFVAPVATPTNLVVFDQKIRRAAGGVVVVDIVTQFDDVPNAQRYEIRLTKI